MFVCKKKVCLKGLIIMVTLVSLDEQIEPITTSFSDTRQ